MQLNPFVMKKCPLFVLLLLLGGTLLAQSVSATLIPGTNTAVARHVERTAGTMVNLTASAVFGSSPTWLYCITRANLGSGNTAANCTPSASPAAVAGLTVSTSGNTFTIDKTAAVTEGKYHIEVLVRRTGQTDGTIEIDLIIRNPLDLLFVLDRSSSMECYPSEDTENIGPGAWPDCITDAPAGSRWDMLKNAIGGFMSNYTSENTLNNDQASLIYFSGGTGNQGSLTSFVSFNNFESNYLADMNNQEDGTVPELATDGTSMGEGLFAALQTRYGGNSNANRRQWLVFMSDGEQNRTSLRWVRSSGSNVGRIIQQSQTNTTPVLNTDNPSIGPIFIYTSGLSTLNSAALLMADMSDEITMGSSTLRLNSNVQAGQEAAFVNDFSNQLFTAVMDDFSPEFIRSERQDLSQDNLQFTVQCNDAVSTMYLSAHFDFPGADRYSYSVEHNGEDVTKQASDRFLGSFVSAFTFDISSMESPSSQGTWIMRAFKAQVEDTEPEQPEDIVGAPPEAAGVEFHALADDHNLSFDGYVQERDIFVGRSLHPVVELSVRQGPVTDATVTATLVKPGADLGDILARTDVPITETSDQTGSCGSQKYAYLRARNTAAFQEVSNLQRTEIELDHQGGGRYTGEFNNLDVSGVYKIIYHAEFTSDTLGFIERTETQTLHVRFAPQDIRLLARIPGKDKGDPGPILLRPAYISGGDTLLLGPGYEHFFSLNSQGAQLAGVRDNCDGSYVLTVNGNMNARGQLYLYDAVVYDGPIIQIDEASISQRHHLSLHVGRTFPDGMLDVTHDEGLLVELDYGYRISSILSAELVAGYYGFQPDFHILGATVYAKAGFFRRGLRISGALGGGVYFPEGMGTTVGYSLRASAYQQIAPRLSAGVDGSYFRLSDPDHRFYTLGVGLLFHF